MVAISRCLVSFALLVANAEGARIARKKGSSDASIVGQNVKDCYSKYDGKPLVQWVSTSAEQRAEVLENITNLGCTDMSEDAGKEFMAICDTESTLALASIDGFQVLHKDAGAFFRGSSGVPKTFAAGDLDSFYANWRMMDARLARVEAAVADSQGVATYEQIGTSIENRPIMAVRFRGNGWKPPMPRIVVNFQQHAREWITGMTGVYTVEYAVQRAMDDPTWLAGVELVVIPLTNPDGTVWSETEERMFRKNRRINEGSSCVGVDLNRNWLPGWGGGQGTSTNRCSDIWYGTAAFSEPEAAAVAAVIDEAPTTIHLDVHSYSQLIIAPFGYKRTLHPRRAVLDVPGLAMQEAIRNTHGLTYEYGGSEILSPSDGVARDYLSSKDGFGWTFELRPASQFAGGFAPDPDQILPAAEEFVAALYAAVDWVKDQKTTPAPPPPCSWTCNLFGCSWGNCREECHECFE